MLVSDPTSFRWKGLDTIKLERPNLGSQTTVATYQMMQYAMRSVLNEHFGNETVKKLFYEAGEIAGQELCKNAFDTTRDFYGFLSQLQDILRELKIGILRIEKSDVKKMNFMFVVAEDLDCSGFSLTEDSVCDYEEGFIAGIMNAYTNRKFSVKKIDCWTTGNRVCRFEVTLR